MAKTNTGLVEFAKSKLGTPYVYGAKGEVVTRAKYNELKRLYGKSVWDSDANKIGQVCVDCSGLISWYTGITRGSTQFKDKAAAVYDISTVANAPIGALVWKSGHIGVYIGNGLYIAADGSKNGVRIGKLPNVFTKWFLCTDIEYGTAAAPVAVAIPIAAPVAASAPSAFAVGDIVRVKPGSYYGGLYEATRGKRVPDWVTSTKQTIMQIKTHKGVQEARLKEINSWVALDFLTKVE